MRTPRILAVLAIAVAACSPRGAITYDPSAAKVGSRQEIFVATSRALDRTTGDFTSTRVPSDNYARFVVQVPPDRKPGRIEWPGQFRKPDPARDFLTVDRVFYDSRDGFKADLSRELAAMPPGQREVRVFVHGFNNTFAEGLYRLAQLDHDLGFPGLSVHYAWPSKAKPLGYFGDRDSAVFSRDGYEQMLRTIVDAGADRIILVGHSMGSLLVMEGLRDMSLARESRVLGRIGGIVLISPDIAVDVFQKEARRIGTLPQPFYVFTSQKDKALKLSASLSGRPDRLGNLTSPKEVEEFKLTLIDVSDFSQKQGHFTVGDSPTLIALLGKMAELDAAVGLDNQNVGVLGGTIMTFNNAQQVVVHAPFGKPGER
jgi:esterase/lipase superfamily enzyme